MPRSRSVLRTFSLGYAVLAGLLALWAWWVDIRLLDSEREHLLPDILLALVTMPSSLTLGWLYQHWPDLFTGLWQTAYVTACAIFQSGVFFIISKWWERKNDA